MRFIGRRRIILSALPSARKMIYTHIFIISLYAHITRRHVPHLSSSAHSLPSRLRSHSPHSISVRLFPSAPRRPKQFITDDQVTYVSSNSRRAFKQIYRKKPSHSSFDHIHFRFSDGCRSWCIPPAPRRSQTLVPSPLHRQTSKHERKTAESVKEKLRRSSQFRENRRD